MKIEVRLFANIRELAGQRAVVEEVPGGASVGDVMRKLCKRFGQGFREQVLDECGEPQKYVKVLLNGYNIAFLKGTATKLKDGDVIAIFPPVGGGCRK